MENDDSSNTKFLSWNSTPHSCKRTTHALSFAMFTVHLALLSFSLTISPWSSFSDCVVFFGFALPFIWVDRDGAVGGASIKNTIRSNGIRHSTNWTVIEVVIPCTVYSISPSAKAVSVSVTNNTGNIDPIAFPIGLHTAPIDVVKSLSSTGNQVEAITGGMFRNTGWAIDANVCPSSIKKYVDCSPILSWYAAAKTLNKAPTAVKIPPRIKLFLSPYIFIENEANTVPGP